MKSKPNTSGWTMQWCYFSGGMWRHAWILTSDFPFSCRSNHGDFAFIRIPSCPFKYHHLSIMGVHVASGSIYFLVKCFFCDSPPFLVYHAVLFCFRRRGVSSSTRRRQTGSILRTSTSCWTWWTWTTTNRLTLTSSSRYDTILCFAWGSFSGDRKDVVAVVALAEKGWKQAMPNLSYWTIAKCKVFGCAEKGFQNRSKSYRVTSPDLISCWIASRCVFGVLFLL